jgi:hypothetical protein
MQATFEARRSQLSVFLIALALLGALILGGAGGYVFKGLQGSVPAPVRSTSGTSAVDMLTGYPSGSAEDLRILALLKQSGYQGGGTVVQSSPVLPDWAYRRQPQPTTPPQMVDPSGHVIHF